MRSVDGALLLLAFLSLMEPRGSYIGLTGFRVRAYSRVSKVVLRLQAHVAREAPVCEFLFFSRFRHITVP